METQLVTGNPQTEEAAKTADLGLTPYQNAELKRILKLKVEYIDNPAFHENDAETKLFEGELPEAQADWYASFVNDMGKSDNPGDSNVLTKEQEAAYFLRMNYCYYRVSLMSDAGIDTREKALEIIKWFRLGEKLKAGICSHNLALVLSIVRKFTRSNLDFDEMLSEGNLILLNAVVKFNVEKGYKFSTYLTWSVQRAFGKASEKKSKTTNFFPVSLDLELQKSDYVDTRREDAFADSIGMLREIIDSNSAGLKELELQVLNERYPRNAPSDFKRPTLEQVGQKLGRNKSNMSRIEASAMEKLREAFKKQLNDKARRRA